MNNLLNQLKILIILILPVYLPAQEALTFVSLGAKTGFLFPNQDIQQTVAFGIDSDWKSSVPNTKIIFSATFWSSQQNEQNNEFDVYSIGLHASLVNEIVIENYSITPYYGGGIGLEFNEYQQNEKYDQDTDLSLNALVGAEMLLSEKLLGIAEAKYYFAGMIDYFAIWLGFKYIF